LGEKYLAAFIMKTANVLQLSLKNCSNIAISTIKLKWVVHRAANKYRRLCLAGWLPRVGGLLVGKRVGKN
jgi:hypothetical protein